MATTMQFDLVSPERKLASVQAHAVQLPGSEGDLTAMAGHAPTITTLRPGVLTVVIDGDAMLFAVTGGFAEISAEGTTVLAERAYEKGPEAKEAIAAILEEAQAAAEAAKGPEKDIAAKQAADVALLLEAMS